MPEIFPSDPPSVIALMEEARRLNGLAHRWENAKPTNPIALNSTLAMSWSMCVAGAWLRCKLKGELEPERTRYSEMQIALGELAFRANNCPPLLDTWERKEAAEFLKTAIAVAEKLLVTS